MKAQNDYYRYWGKTNRRKGYVLKKESDGNLVWQHEKEPENRYPLSYHLLPYHNLDVAAVAWVFLERDCLLRQRLASGLGFDEDQLKNLFCTLLALHDIGKFAEGFQHLCKLLAEKLRSDGAIQAEKPYLVRHDTLGYLLWRDVLHPVAITDDWFKTRDVGDNMSHEDWRDYFDPIMQAVTGHHGAPPQPGSHAARRLFSRVAQENVLAYARDIISLFQPLRPPDDFDYDKHLTRARRSTWQLAGLAILADWIGSDASHFSYTNVRMPLKEYWNKVALPRAKKAVEMAGVIPPKVAVTNGMEPLHHLFPGLRQHDPTPLQDYVTRCSLAEGPQLFILEDATGAGKTEAALILAHRLMQAGEASGLYFGLPTMTTADRIHKRLLNPYQALFEENGSGASLILAHSNRDLNPVFRNTLRIGNPTAEAGEQYGDRAKDEAKNDEQKEETGQAECAAWLADNRKAALLASVGAGTVDQALLGVLPSKHQALRLLGLSRHVLIVDEVHAYDEYVSRLLRELLAFQAAQGGSVILLSATLTAEQRQKLCDAFCDGLQRERRPLQNRDDFPLVTRVASNGEPVEQPVDSAPGTARTVDVRLLHKKRDVHSALTEAARSKQCACWIRNTVDDAVQAWRDLRAQHEHPERVLLFHARMAQSDRASVAEKVERRFGKESQAKDRAGYILVATQVVEQSLDLDFDVMVSDLAPIDLLIQRAGRLHRHPRTAAGDPKPEGHDERNKPELLVLAPSFELEPDNVVEEWGSEEDKKDYNKIKSPEDQEAFAWGLLYSKKFYPKARFVYPHVGMMWRTARVLNRHGRIAIPELARTLLCEVYGEAAEAIPESLQKASNEAINEMKLARARAGHNALHLDGGYGSLKAGGQRWYSPERTPTRLGEPTTTVRLARWENDELIPWAAKDAEEFHTRLREFKEAKQNAEEQGWAEETRDAVLKARADLMELWRRSELSVLQRWLADGPKLNKQEQAVLDTVKAAMPDEGRWTVLVSLKREETEEAKTSWTGEARDGNGNTVRLIYSPDAGLEVERK